MVEVLLLALTSDPLALWATAVTALAADGSDDVLAVSVVDMADPHNWTREQAAAVLDDLRLS
ncbi:MAG: hypothetical protein ACRDJN_02240 [Chloroflexota bacterium]